MSRLRPLGDKVLIRRTTADSKTAGGIFLPDSAKEKPKQGTIVSVGEGRLLKNGQRQALVVKPGDRVLFSSYAGSEVKVDGDDMVIMEESEILAVLG